MRLRRLCVAALSVAALFLVAGSPTTAQVSQPTCQRSATPRTLNPQLLAARSYERQACAADLAAYCGEVARGCGRPMQCLRAHSLDLSQGCRTALLQLSAAHRAAPNTH